MTLKYAPAAQAAIQQVYDNPEQEQLADRLEELIELLETDPGDKRVRRQRMQDPGFWLVKVYGSKREFAFFWDQQGDDTWIHWAGDF